MVVLADNNASSPKVPRRRMLWPLASTRLTLLLFCALVAAFMLTRVLFYLLHGDLAVRMSTSKVLYSFLVGMRFDTSTAALLLLPWIPLMHLPFTDKGGKTLRRILMPGLILVGAAASLIAISDCLYYAHSAKRFSYEPLLLFQIGGKLMEFTFGEHPILVPFLITCVLVYWGFIWHWARRKFIPAGRSAPYARLRIVLWGVLLLGFSVIGIRGGLQSSVLGIGNAYFSDDIVINHASLNPVYTFVQSFSDDHADLELITPQKALTAVRSAVVEPEEKFIDERFPLARKFSGGHATSSQNVVLVIAESLTAEFMGAYGDPQGATPNLDQVASQGVLFERFFSSGSRSSHGVFATLFSVPAQTGSPVMHTTLILNNFRSLAQILKDSGYETIFIYGGIYEFTNAYGVLKNSGFEKIIADPLPSDPPVKPRAWGYDDEYMFDRLHHELARPGDKPRFAVLFTQNLHGHEAPEDLLQKAGGVKVPRETRHHSYYNLIYYTDWCFGQFFAKAKQQPYFNNTVFAITADHTRHINPNLYENYHIPFIVYAPGLLNPARYATVGSQLDILPTILGVLNLETEHASFGRDLIQVASRRESGFAYLMLGDTIGWVEGPWILQDFLDKSSPKLYDYVANPALTQNHAARHSNLALEMRNKARSFMQVSRRLLDENRIFPLAFTGGREQPAK